MSNFRDLIIDIQEAIYASKISFAEIAKEFGVDVDFVNQVAEEMREWYDEAINPV